MAEKVSKLARRRDTSEDIVGENGSHRFEKARGKKMFLSQKTNLGTARENSSVSLVKAIEKTQKEKERINSLDPDSKRKPFTQEIGWRIGSL